MKTYIKRQKIIKVGNSYAVTLDKSFVDQNELQVHDVTVAYNVDMGVMSLAKTSAALQGMNSKNVTRSASIHGKITPELQHWTDNFLKRNAQALEELSHA